MLVYDYKKPLKQGHKFEIALKRDDYLIIFCSEYPKCQETKTIFLERLD